RGGGVEEALVVDEAHRPLGLVGMMDLARARISGVMPDGEVSRKSFEELTAADVARPLMVWVEPHAMLQEVADIMARTGQKRVAVLQGGAVIGEVLRDDVDDWLRLLSPARTLGGAERRW
ncbi:MAG: CBS domain-containing protein, partial [Myxococcota bacterium]